MNGDSGVRIHILGDIRVRCPRYGCPLAITLTREGAEMMLAQQTKCREHGLSLVVDEPEEVDEINPMSDQNDLPEGVVARINVMVNGVRINLRQGMTDKDFADMLHAIADAYEQGAHAERQVP